MICVCNVSLYKYEFLALLNKEDFLLILNANIHIFAVSFPRLFHYTENVDDMYAGRREETE